MINIKIGDCRHVLKKLPSNHFHTCVTSPPYWGLRDYGSDCQLGLEETPKQFVDNLVEVFREVKRVLRDDGTLWINLGDSYNTTQAGNKTWGDGVGANKHYQMGVIPKKRKVEKNLKPKDLVGIPWKVAFALQEDGWYLRQDIIWHKPNPMPESVKDRCTKAHEYIFLLSKSKNYYFDKKSIYENKNKRSVWTITTKPYKEAHFATYPPDLIEPCILAGCPENGNILDPFGGAGTTGLVADRLNRNATIIELNKEYIKIADKRIKNDAPLFAKVINS
tara:strand:+ start:55 stop:885 length:831 start_codon:yes stop_codon:yes gene_type:complete